MYQNYIFDLYGTLIDIRTDESMPDFWRKVVSVYARYGASYSPGELKRAYMRCVRREFFFESLRRPFIRHRDIDLLKVFARLYSDKGVAPSDEQLRDTAKRFRKASTSKLCLYDGVTDLLDSLKAAGKGIYLLSNAQESFTLPEMEELGVLDYFDGVVISSNERMCKPERAFFELLLKRYGLDRQSCVMIGNDQNSDMAGARRAGIDGLYIRQEISPPVENESDIPAKWRIMDGDVRKIKGLVLRSAEAE